MTNRGRTRRIAIACAFLPVAFVVSPTSLASNDSTHVVAVVLSHPVTAADVNPSTSDVASHQATGTAEEHIKWLRNYRARNLVGIITTHIFKAYAEENNLTPSEDDLATYLKMVEPSRDEAHRRALEIVCESTNFTAKQKTDFLAAMETRTAGKADAKRKLAKAVIENWNVQEALHRAYGGRLLLSSFGTHVAVDANMKYLRDEATKGAFQINDEADRQAFWEHLADTNWGDGVATEEEANRILDNPPWKVSVSTSGDRPNLAGQQRQQAGPAPTRNAEAIP